VLAHVVDGDRELIRPVAIPILQEQIAALQRGSLFNAPKQQIVEHLRSLVQDDTNAAPGDRIEPALATTAGIPFTADVLARALARVDVRDASKSRQRLLVGGGIIALTLHRTPSLVRGESEPVEIVDKRRFVRSPAADAIVILDPQPHTSAERTRDAPDVNGVRDVAEVQVPCR